MTILIIWLVFWGILGAVLASSKGRGAIRWAIACAIFGLFGILILAVTPNLAERRRQDERDARMLEALAPRGRADA